MGKIFYNSVSLLLVLVGIIGANNIINGQQQIGNNKSATDKYSDCFSLPDIPLMITTNNNRANYLVMHWWDNFNFSDNNCIRQTDIGEQAFVDFIDILNLVSADQAQKAVQHLMLQSSKDNSGEMYRYFFKISEKYLYDPNSPFRNEELYALFIEHSLKSKLLNDDEKLRPAAQLKDINKNRRGTIANDFDFIMSNGKHDTLHNIQSEFILIYFNNPDCTDCKRMKSALERSSAINNLLKNNKLKLLSLFVDEEIDIWKKHQNELSSNWIDARDGTSGFKIQKQLYTIRAIPSLYLLDKEKRVLLKDIDIQEVEEFLNTKKL